MTPKKENETLARSRYPRAASTQSKNGVLIEAAILLAAQTLAGSAKMPRIRS
jgi:hypothetical protein